MTAILHKKPQTARQTDLVVSHGKIDLLGGPNACGHFQTALTILEHDRFRLHRSRSLHIAAKLSRSALPALRFAELAGPNTCAETCFS